jgi:hypothetical protein
VPVRNSGHLQFFQAGDDDYRRTRVATSKGFQHGDAVHPRIEIDDDEIDVIQPGHKDFKSTPAVVYVLQTTAGPRRRVGNDCIRIPRTIRHEKDISFHDYTSAGSKRGGLSRIVIFTANIARRNTVLRMSILRTRNALLLTSGGKRPGVGAIKLEP